MESNFLSYLYVLDISPLLNLWLVKIFSQSVGGLLVLLTVSFACTSTMQFLSQLLSIKGVTETKFRAEMEERTIQRLPHPGIHPIYNHQTQTLLHIPARFCWQDPDIAISYEAMPVLGKYRSGCSQSSIRWNTGPLMRELEKVPKEPKGSATL